MNLNKLNQNELTDLAANVATALANREAEHEAIKSLPARRQLDRSQLLELAKSGVIEYADIRNADLSSANLIGLQFNDCTFENCAFTLAKLDQTTFSRCSFRGNIYRAISMKDARFVRCTIRGFIIERAADVRGIQFESTRIIAPIQLSVCYDDDGPIPGLAAEHRLRIRQFTHNQFLAACKAERADREAAAVRSVRENEVAAAQVAFRQRCAELRDVSTSELIRLFNQSPNDDALCHVIDFRIA